MNRIRVALLLWSALPACSASLALAQPKGAEQKALSAAAVVAQQQLKQTFTNLQFEDFGPSPIQGPIYQANAGGRMVYYAPQSEHILFAAAYDRNGVNVTALAQDAAARKRLAGIDLGEALAIGPGDAPSVIEFTDPDCPYCRALDRYWATKAAAGRPVRRHIFFVSGIHPQAAAKAEHILCAVDKEAAFKAIYTGAAPEKLGQCDIGHSRLTAHSKAVSQIGVSGTPTLILGGKIISGFQQGEIEAFLDDAKASDHAAR